MNRSIPLFALAPFALLAACESDEAGTGRIDVTIYGEAFIEEGIPAGMAGCDGCVEDGWAVTFDRFLVSVARVEVAGVADDTARIFDLTRPSGGAGHPVVSLDVPATHHHALSYTLAPAPTAVAGNVDAADVALMVDGGWSVHVEGRAERGGEVKTFTWSFDRQAAYVDCEIDAHVTDGGAAGAELTIHADHLLYDDLDSEEPQVVFDLLAASDADGDGAITRAELEARDITAEARYQVGSRSIDDLWGFVSAQVGTLGHIDGEGHCEQR